MDERGAHHFSRSSTTTKKFIEYKHTHSFIHCVITSSSSPSFKFETKNKYLFLSSAALATKDTTSTTIFFCLCHCCVCLSCAILQSRTSPIHSSSSPFHSLPYYYYSFVWTGEEEEKKKTDAWSFWIPSLSHCHWMMVVDFFLLFWMPIWKKNVMPVIDRGHRNRNLSIIAAATTWEIFLFPFRLAVSVLLILYGSQLVVVVFSLFLTATCAVRCRVVARSWWERQAIKSLHD